MTRRCILSYMAKSLIWSNEYSLGVAVIDDQHKKFVGAIDELYESIQNGDSQQNLGGILKELVEYHNVHFATE
jgi:hemerythrin